MNTVNFFKTALGWFAMVFEWIYDNLIDVTFFGINVHLILITLLISSLAFRYFVMPLLAGRFTIGKSDSVDDGPEPEDNDRDRNILRERYHIK